MMKLLFAAAIIGPIACGLAACSGSAPQQVDAICQKVDALPASAVAEFDALEPHGAAGQLWLYAKASCKDAAALATVSPNWRKVVWDGFKQAVPLVLPKLIPLIALAL